MSTKQTELTTFVFKDTGISVKIKKVSPLLVMEVQKALKTPVPPMQEVDYGDGKKKLEPNEASPEYQKALEAYNIEVEQAVRKLIIRRGVIFDLTDEQKEEVRELRQFWKDNYKTELDGTDVEIFISYIAIGSPEDLQELIQAVMQRSQPTEEVIKRAQDSFPS